jgi:hypothetical protein
LVGKTELWSHDAGPNVGALVARESDSFMFQTGPNIERFHGLQPCKPYTQCYYLRLSIYFTTWIVVITN